MSGIARATDISSGHGCFPPEKVIAPLVSPDVFVEKRAVLRDGDMLQPHCCGKSCHQGVAKGGSTTIFANGKPIMRIKDQIKCGKATSVMITGAVRTIAGG